MTGPRVFHPFLLGLYPPLALYAHGINIVFFENALSGFAISIGYAAVLFGVFWLFFRNAGKAGLVTSVLILFAFFYGHMNNFLASVFFTDQLTLAGELPRIVKSWSIRIWGIGFGVLVIWLCWRKGHYPNLTKVLNVVTLALLAVPAAAIAGHFWAQGGDKAGPPDSTNPTAIQAGTLKPKQPAPDIYYLIFDRYGSREALSLYSGFDNRPFLDALKERGFYVAEKSVANYMGSHQSLASSLNMTYLDHLTEKFGRNSGDFNPLSEIMQDHAVQRLLKGAGYRYFHLGSTWEVTRLNKYADVNFSGKAPNEFLSVLMQTNAIPIIARKWDIQIKWIESKCFRVNAKLDMLKEIATRKETTFTFSHILLPHEPYVFDADGRCLSEKETNKRDWKTNFLAQLRYANTRILEVVDAIIRASDVPPVIIIQADEGPYPVRVIQASTEGRDFDWRKEATPEEWRHKMGILNALYLPDLPGGKAGSGAGAGAAGLHPAITPVNTFRIVFNKYFGAGFEILEDRSFTYPDIDHVYDFYEITDRLK